MKTIKLAYGFDLNTSKCYMQIIYPIIANLVNNIKIYIEFWQTKLQFLLLWEVVYGGGDTFFFWSRGYCHKFIDLLLERRQVFVSILRQTRAHAVFLWIKFLHILQTIYEIWEDIFGVGGTLCWDYNIIFA